MFAKIFYSEEYGQILLKIDTDEDGNPEIRAYIEPDGFGVCSLALKSDNDSQEAFDNFSDAFSKMDEKDSIALLSPLLKSCGLLNEEGEK